MIKSAGNLGKDGIYDQWNITMRVKTPEEGFKLAQANIIAAFGYQIDGSVKMQMESLAVSQVSIPASSMSVRASKVTTSGTLRLKQTSAIAGADGLRNTYNDRIFD